MMEQWPGKWERCKPEPVVSNKDGTRYFIDVESGSYISMEDVPSGLENRC